MIDDNDNRIIYMHIYIYILINYMISYIRDCTNPSIKQLRASFTLCIHLPKSNPRCVEQADIDLFNTVHVEIRDLRSEISFSNHLQRR